MKKAQALLNFQAVTNYLMWKYTCPIYLDIKQEFNYFELELHFEPEEISEDVLREKVDRIRDVYTKLEITNIQGHSAKCLSIRWNYVS